MSEQIFTSRVFAVPDATSSQPEWYCLTREEVMGPFSSEHIAQQALEEFIQLCQQLGWHGDREPGRRSEEPA